MTQHTSTPIATRTYRGIWLAIVIALTAAAIGLYLRGKSFYLLPLPHRADHPEYRTLGPSGLWGHGYGIVGFGLILTNLTYLVRRRFAAFRFGSLRAWLDMHVFTGLLGSLLVLFHSAFQLRTPLATLTSASLALVVVTGVLGRFLYAIAPQPDLARKQALIDELQRLLPGLGAQVQQALDAHRISYLQTKASMLRVIFMVPRWLKQGRQRRRIVRVCTKGPIKLLQQPSKRRAKMTSKELGKVAAGEARSLAGSMLLNSWRGLHRLFAILMLVSAAVHVAVAWFFGYRWIFE